MFIYMLLMFKKTQNMNQFMLLINTQTLCWCLLDWCPCSHVIMVIKQHRMRVNGKTEAYSQLFTHGHLHLFK